MYELASQFVDPVTLGLILLLAALLRTRLQRGRPLLVLTLVALVLTAACHPVTAWILLRGLEAPYPPITFSSGAGEPIVVLGGGIRQGPGGSVTLSDDSRSRVLHALLIYRLGGRPVIVVSGGPPPTHPEMPAVAGLMRDVLVAMGVPASEVVTESASRSTYENALLTRPLLAAHSVRRIVLVTEAYHMPRSAAVFRAQGFEVVAAPTAHRTSDAFSLGEAWLPSSPAARATALALHEWVGMGWYWLRGRFD